MLMWKSGVRKDHVDVEIQGTKTSVDVVFGSKGCFDCTLFGAIQHSELYLTLIEKSVWFEAKLEVGNSRICRW